MPQDSEFSLLDPGASKHVTLSAEQQRRRLMIIGDVHGCCGELKKLIEEYGKKDDLIILAGDLVNKGPKSVETVRLARELGALAVIGNHDLASLRGYHSRKSDPLSELAYQWTDGLNQEDVSYLSGLPYTISIPAHNAIVVHAGLVPEVPLSEQRPRDMVAMRNLKCTEGVWEAFELESQGDAWASQWKGPQHVYFGHDAKRKLQLADKATGLDTGCLYGGHLSAAILSPNGTREIVSVKAQTPYRSLDRAKPPPPGLRRSKVLLCVVCVATALAFTYHRNWRGRN